MNNDIISIIFVLQIVQLLLTIFLFGFIIDIKDEINRKY